MTAELFSGVSRRRLMQTVTLGIAAAGSGAHLDGLRVAHALAQTPVAGDDLTAAAVDAWLYGYPLVTMGVTAGISTNVDSPQDDKAPYNQFFNKRDFPDASFTTVVAPNVDTLYSSAFLDLATEPIVFQWPDMGTRYFLFPILNAWTDVTSFGSRTTGQGAGTLVIAGPGWDGSVPAGVSLPENTIGLRMPTNLGWILGRIYCAGTDEDYAAVHANQDQLRLVPLSAWGSSYTPPAGTVDPAVNMTTSPLEQVNTMAAAAYFGSVAELMAANPPNPADAPILARMAALGIASGKPFNITTRDPGAQQALEAATKAGLEKLQAEGPTSVRNENGWQFSVGLGDYGTDYLLRAYVSLIGLGANLSADAVYPAAFTDSTGEPLTGANKYVVHFDTLPPVKGFWSLTAYTAHGFLIDNPLNRYAIRGNDPLQMSPGGALDLYLQAESPGADKEANWLPSGTEQFSVYLRTYWPEEAILDGTWTLPTVTKVS